MQQMGPIVLPRQMKEDICSSEYWWSETQLALCERGPSQPPRPIPSEALLTLQWP